MESEGYGGPLGLRLQRNNPLSSHPTSAQVAAAKHEKKKHRDKKINTKKKESDDELYRKSRATFGNETHMGASGLFLEEGLRVPEVAGSTKSSNHHETVKLREKNKYPSIIHHLGRSDRVGCASKDVPEGQLACHAQHPDNSDYYWKSERVVKRAGDIQEEPKRESSPSRAPTLEVVDHAKQKHGGKKKRKKKTKKHREQACTVASHTPAAAAHAEYFQEECLELTYTTAVAETAVAVDHRDSSYRKNVKMSDLAFAAKEFAEDHLTSSGPPAISKHVTHVKSNRKMTTYFGAEEFVEEQLVCQKPPATRSHGKRASCLESEYTSFGAEELAMEPFLTSQAPPTVLSSSNRSIKSLALASAGPIPEDVLGPRIATMASGSLQSTQSRPGVEHVDGPLRGGTSGVSDNDPLAMSPTRIMRGAIVVEAELVRDRTVDAIPMSQETEEGYRERVQKESCIFRKRVLACVIASLLLIVGIVVAMVAMATRWSQPLDPDPSSFGGTLPPPLDTGLSSPGGTMPPPLDHVPSSSGEPMATPTKGDTACGIDLAVTCTVTDRASKTCNEITTSCTSRPVTLVFQYNGSKCSESFHNQRASSFICLDMDNQQEDASSQAYIVAYDVATGRVYRQSLVAFDGIFWATDYESRLGATMNITVYNSSDTSPDNIIQTFVYQSDCSQDLSLTNRFGALILTRIVTEEQGVLTSDNGFVNITYTFTVFNSESENLTVKSINATANLDEFDLVVDEGVVAPGSSQYFYHTLSLDVTTYQVYTLDAAATAVVVQDGTITESCFAFGFLEFEAGLKPPTSSPTFAPGLTASPTIHPTTHPTLSSDAGGGPPTLPPCLLIDVQVDCTLLDGSTNCSPIPPLLRTACEQRPITMGFRYSGGNCTQSSNDEHAPSQEFQCTDVSDLNSWEHQSVFLVVFDVLIGTIYESRPIEAGEVFSVQDLAMAGNTINITAYTLSDAGSPQNMIQTVVIDRSCRSTAPLSLGDRFGSFQLMVYANDLQGVMTNVVEVTFTTSISSSSPLATIRSVESSIRQHDFGGFRDHDDVYTNLTNSVDSTIIEPGETVHVKQTVRLDLSYSDQFYQYSALVTVILEDGSECKSFGDSSVELDTWW